MTRNLKKLSVLLLSAATVFASSAPVTASTEQALQVPVSFSGAGWEDEFWNTSTAEIITGINDDSYPFSDSFSLSYQLYIPKTVLEPEGSALITSASLDLMEANDEWTWIGWVGSDMGITLMRWEDTYNVTYWDEAAQEDKDASSYASTEVSGDYIILTVKNLPLSSIYHGENDVTAEIDTSKSGRLNANVSIQGVGNKIDTSIYLDNLSVASGADTLATKDYSTDDSYLAYRINNIEDIETTPSSFTNSLLTLSKTSATIKKGKTVTIKASAAPAAKITYKSSNKKVATVNAKGVVKGKKAGKATITVSANGVSRTFTVKVKK